MILSACRTGPKTGPHTRSIRDPMKKGSLPNVAFPLRKSRIGKWLADMPQTLKHPNTNLKPEPRCEL